MLEFYGLAIYKLTSKNNSRLKNVTLHDLLIFGSPLQYYKLTMRYKPTSRYDCKVVSNISQVVMVAFFKISLAGILGFITGNSN